jgi:hypothetical protein
VGALPPDARGLLDTYLEFSRFPLLGANDNDDRGITLTWLDLRFSVPGRRSPLCLPCSWTTAAVCTACRVGGARLPMGKSS